MSVQMPLTEQPRRLLSDASYAKIDRELTKYPSDQKRSAVMSALRIAQVEHGQITPDLEAEIAAYLEMPPMAVHEVATFYNMYNLKPVGCYKLTLCTNLPCALRSGNHAAAYLQHKLGVGFGGTTPDGLFTLQEGECLGACGDSPVMLVNNHKMCSWMSNDKIDALIEELRAGAATKGER
ncbi:NuoE NADH,ubiquinone oxidoreductase 24 kD subunit [Burkholderiales bacterium]